MLLVPNCFSFLQIGLNVLNVIAWSYKRNCKRIVCSEYMSLTITLSESTLTLLFHPVQTYPIQTTQASTREFLFRLISFNFMGGLFSLYVFKALYAYSVLCNLGRCIILLGFGHTPQPCRLSSFKFVNDYVT